MLAPHPLELVDEIDVGADPVDLVDLNDGGRRGDVDLGEELTDEVEPEEVETHGVEVLGHHPAGVELFGRRVQGRSGRTLVQIGETRALRRNSQDRTEHSLIDGQDPEIAAGFDGVEEGLNDDLRTPLLPIATEVFLLLVGW